MGSFSTSSVWGENGNVRRRCVHDLLADAVQVDLRFNADFGECFWVTDARKLKHLRSKVFYSPQDDRALTTQG
jgi:hypothetical protein